MVTWAAAATRGCRSRTPCCTTAALCAALRGAWEHRGVSSASLQQPMKHRSIKEFVEQQQSRLPCHINRRWGRCAKGAAKARAQTPEAAATMEAREAGTSCGRGGPSPAGCGMSCAAPAPAAPNNPGCHSITRGQPLTFQAAALVLSPTSELVFLTFYISYFIQYIKILFVFSKYV